MQLKLFHSDFESFVRSLQLDEYRDLLAKVSNKVSEGDSRQSAETQSLVDELCAEAQEVARLEFKLMWKRVTTELDGKFDHYLKTRKGLDTETTVRKLLS